MYDEVRKSIQLILHERITSPMSGALILSWFVWNWKIPYFLLFSDGSLTLLSRIAYVETHYFDYVPNLILPIASALFLVLIYPFATTGALSAWLRFRGWQNSIKNRIEGNQLLTLEQSLQIKMQMRRQQSELADLVRSRDEEIELLRRENKALRDKLNPTPEPNAETSMIQLSDLAKKILMEASQDPNGAVRIIEHSTGMFVQAHGIVFGEKASAREQAELRAAIEELVNHDFLDAKSSTYYQVTDQGYKIADRFRVTP